MSRMIPEPKPGEKPDPDKVLVEALIRRPAQCDYVWAWVTLREAWIMGQPGLVPPPGHHVGSWLS